MSSAPDEYHLDVDDNAFTNVIARWNLRRAAALAERAGGATAEEVEAWRRLADALGDGYEPATGRYRQFNGFDDLEPLLLGELARPPVAADVLLGRSRVRGAQVVKQADVLMLRLLVPEETAPGSLAPNPAFYGPRIAHGSSLSPAVHADLLARAGDPDRALELFRLACRLDLDDLTGTTARWPAPGHHGWRVAGPGVRVPGTATRRAGRSAWTRTCPTPGKPCALACATRQRLVVQASHDRLQLLVDGPVPVGLPGLPARTVAPPGASWQRSGPVWKEEPR
jgi:Glycosyl hydrolase family 65 central catalytic domain